MEIFNLEIIDSTGLHAREVRVKAERQRDAIRMALAKIMENCQKDCKISWRVKVFEGAPSGVISRMYSSITCDYSAVGGIENVKTIQGHL